MPLKLMAILFVGLLASQFLPTPALSDGSKNVYVLLYYSGGGYSVDYVEVQWKNPGETEGKYDRWGGGVPVGEGFCLNLIKVDKI